MNPPEFVGWPKIARFSREVIVTEKIDGTNAQILVNDAGDDLIAGSRTKWITPEDDNAGFARWVSENKTKLLRLGPGAHFGEWWGGSIQRKYGVPKQFSLFNVTRWSDPATRPACCNVVPTLWRGNLDAFDAFEWIERLRAHGSVAAPGFMRPEGIVIFHVASGQLFKKTLEKDFEPKGMNR